MNENNRMVSHEYINCSENIGAPIVKRLQQNENPDLKPFSLLQNKTEREVALLSWKEISKMHRDQSHTRIDNKI